MRVLIVAFDGLDYELIKKYNCEEIQQEEFGKIDNQTGIKHVMTSELFASFITGKTWKEHGMIGLGIKISSGFLDKIRNLLIRVHPKLQALVDPLVAALSEINFFNLTRREVMKKDLGCNTIFEEVENSRALFVPAFNPELNWAVGNNVLKPVEYEEYGIKETIELIERDQKHRKEELFRELKKGYDLLMVHFHKPDWYHHILWETGRKEGIEGMYEEMEGLANRIKGKAKGYDYIIFMSDHGLPTKGAHNENAFYSCNKELFPDKVPHITDFYNKILEITGKKEIKGVRI